MLVERVPRYRKIRKFRGVLRPLFFFRVLGFWLAKVTRPIKSSGWSGLAYLGSRFSGIL
uniref:Uncharacterized protein n=1 Tax=Helianthus annuus TaxID=4232 RepID=A0A251VFW3_HELAN